MREKVQLKKIFSLTDANNYPQFSLSFSHFSRLLNMDLSSDIGARSSSESSMVSSTFGESTTADFNDDTEYLIRADQKPTTR